MVLRKLLKIIGILVVSLTVLLIGVVVNLVGLMTPRHLSHARADIQRVWARLICSILGLRIVSRHPSGLSPTQRGFFVVSNHISYLDIVVLAATLPAAFLSKHEVRGWPLLGWLATLAGTVYVDRAAKRSALGALEDIEERLSHGVNVIVFPEGTTSDGCQVLPFKSTFFDLPARLMIPVLPVAVRYLSVDGDLLSAQTCSPVAWCGDAPLGPSVWRVLGMQRIEVRVTGSLPIVAESGSDRKALARAAQAEVGTSYWTLLDI